MFHRHKWVVVSKEEQPSSWDAMVDAGMKKFNAGWESMSELTRKEIIVQYRCECGAEKVRRV